MPVRRGGAIGALPSKRDLRQVALCIDHTHDQDSPRHDGVKRQPALNHKVARIGINVRPRWPKFRVLRKLLTTLLDAVNHPIRRAWPGIGRKMKPDF